MKSTTPLIAIEDARKLMLSELPASPRKKELVPIEQALNRILAEDVYSAIDVPAFDNSAMDGVVIAYNDFALQGQDRVLTIETVIKAGDTVNQLSKNHAARIFTGAMLPENADTVIPVEECEFLFNEKLKREGVKFLREVKKGSHVRKKAQDIASKQKVFPVGHKLRPQDIGLLASLGLNQIHCYQPFLVGLVSTGDELLIPGQKNEQGKIYNSNQYMLQALIGNLGFEVKIFEPLKDDLENTMKMLLHISQECDCVVSTGGVSVGGADFVKQALVEIGEMHLWRLAIKPGKPFVFGKINQKPFFGLPGNPVAVFITFFLLVKPALFKMLSIEEHKSVEINLPANFSLKANSKRMEFLRVSVAEQDGTQYLKLYENQSSGVLSSICYSDGLAVIPIGLEVKPGDLLSFIPFEFL